MQDGGESSSDDNVGGGDDWDPTEFGEGGDADRNNGAVRERERETTTLAWALRSECAACGSVLWLFFSVTNKVMFLLPVGSLSVRLVSTGKKTSRSTSIGGERLGDN